MCEDFPGAAAIDIHFGLFVDLLRRIKDPEKPASLEELNVVYEEGVTVMEPTASNVSVVGSNSNQSIAQSIAN